MLAAQLSAVPVPVVSWGQASDIVGATYTFSSGQNSSAVSLSTLISPPVGPDYYPNATATNTPEFYGAAYFTLDGSQLDSSTYRMSAGTPNAIGFFASMAGGTPKEAQFIALWSQDYFSNGGDAGTVTLSSLTASVHDNSSNNTTVFNYVIRLGSSFYISEQFSETGSGGSNTLSNPASANWYAYDPLTSFIDPTLNVAASISDFSNLTAAGVYVSDTTSAAAINSPGISLFTVQGEVAVPEPAHVALLMMGAIGAITLWRRRRK